MIKHEGANWVLYSMDGKKKLGTHSSKADAETQERLIQAKMKTAESRSLHLLGALGQVRTEMVGDKEHLIVPVVMLMEGVIHAVNAETPEFVPFETLQKCAESWNGKPITIGHPKKNGTQCSASENGIWDSHGIGLMRNVRVDAASKKMLGEALVEKSRAKNLHPDMYADLADGKSLEVSVGAMVISDHKTGKHGVKPYVGSWTFAEGDHLAFLPGGRGACSMEMGCGTHRAAMRVCADHLTFVALDNPEGINQYTKGSAHEATKAAHQATLSADAASHGLSSAGGRGHENASNRHDEARQFHEEAAKANKAVGNKTLAVHHEVAAGHHDKQAAYHASRSELSDRYMEANDAIASESGVRSSLHRIPACLTFTALEDQPLSQRIDAVQRAIMDEWNDPPEPPKPYAYASQIFDDFVIVCKGEETFKVPYTVDGEDVTLGKPVAVKQQWVAASDDGEIKVLAGARHSTKDMSAIQAVHDHSMALGATCDRGNYKLMERNTDDDPSKLKTFKLDDPTRSYIRRVTTGAR
ncbi:MAG: hypothetical protein V4529_16940 [Gemmatimonadota bacterium]